MFRRLTRFEAFFASDSAGGIVLMLAAIAAMIAANMPVSPLYTQFVSVSHFAINDFLMAIFFLYAGLEIKREMVVGALSSKQKAALPVIAAICGMVAPALIYLYFAPDFRNGWAIPSATDIAFALGVLALLGKRVPASLKVLLLAIAVIDDLGAILVIVLFYSGGVDWHWLSIALVVTSILMRMNRTGVLNLIPYIALGLVLWGTLWQAGVHPTIAGVILGFCIPMARLRALQHAIERWVVFGIMPLFGFANAGVSVTGLGLSSLANPVTMGIGLGLFLGKPIGIFTSIYICVRGGLCDLAADVQWRHIFGLGLLCGVGFTMALFIGALAFAAPDMGVYVRMGVMGGSVLSALLGYTVLYCSGSRA